MTKWIMNTFSRLMMGRCEMIVEDDSDINNNQEQWRVSSALGDPNNAQTHAKHSQMAKMSQKDMIFFTMRFE